jgi:hypothetical protein
MLAICASCGSGGGGGGTGGESDAPGAQAPASVALTWSGTDAVVGYVVHWGTAPRAYSHDIDVRKPVADAQGTVMVVVALDAGERAATYYFAITAYDTAGNSSAYSNELSLAATSIE